MCSACGSLSPREVILNGAGPLGVLVRESRSRVAVGLEVAGRYFCVECVRERLLATPAVITPVAS